MRTSIRWRKIQVPSKDGSLIPWTVEDSEGEILKLIQAMPKKTPIDFESAYRMQWVEDSKALWAVDVDRKSLFEGTNWIGWLSTQGYHIELTPNDYKVITYEPPKIPEWKKWAEDAAKPRPPGLGSLGINFIQGGKTYSIGTTTERPPIQFVVELKSNLIEIHYTTGETELARSCGCEDYLIVNLIEELFCGKPAAIKKFKWAA